MTGNNHKRRDANRKDVLLRMALKDNARAEERLLDLFRKEGAIVFCDLPDRQVDLFFNRLQGGNAELAVRFFSEMGDEPHLEMIAKMARQGVECAAQCIAGMLDEHSKDLSFLEKHISWLDCLKESQLGLAGKCCRRIRDVSVLGTQSRKGIKSATFELFRRLRKAVQWRHPRSIAILSKELNLDDRIKMVHIDIPDRFVSEEVESDFVGYDDGDIGVNNPWIGGRQKPRKIYREYLVTTIDREGLEKASNSDSEIMVAYGCFLLGDGNDGSKERALELFKRADNIGNAAGTNNYAVMLCRDRQYGEAKKWFEKAARSDVPIAKLNLRWIRLFVD